MDVGVDETRHDEPAARVDPLTGSGAGEIAEGGHRPAADSDVRLPAVRGEPAGRNHEVERVHVRDNTRPPGACRVPRDPDAP